MDKAKTGSRGEVEAARYLRENGYRILAQITVAVWAKLTLSPKMKNIFVLPR